MSEEVQFNLRIPAELKKQIMEAAKKNSRSINAEAQLRLEATFSQDDQVPDLLDRVDDLENEVEWLKNNLLTVMQEQGLYDPNPKD